MHAWNCLTSTCLTILENFLKIRLQVFVQMECMWYVSFYGYCILVSPTVEKKYGRERCIFFDSLY